MTQRFEHTHYCAFASISGFRLGDRHQPGRAACRRAGNLRRVAVVERDVELRQQLARHVVRAHHQAARQAEHAAAALHANRPPRALRGRKPGSSVLVPPVRAGQAQMLPKVDGLGIAACIPVAVDHAVAVAGDGAAAAAGAERWRTAAGPPAGRGSGPGRRGSSPARCAGPGEVLGRGRCRSRLPFHDPAEQQSDHEQHDRDLDEGESFAAVSFPWSFSRVMERW